MFSVISFSCCTIFNLNQGTTEAISGIHDLFFTKFAKLSLDVGIFYKELDEHKYIFYLLCIFTQKNILILK